MEQDHIKIVGRENIKRKAKDKSEENPVQRNNIRNK